MLNDKTVRYLDNAIGMAGADGYTVVGIAISKDQSEVRPFGNVTVIPEFVYNLLTGANMVATDVYDTSSISAAVQDIVRQAQQKPINEA